MATARLIRVLLVDDHAMVRQGVRTLLEAYPDIEVVGEAGDGEEGLRQVEMLQPSVVVMDITMPQMDGVTSTRLIKTSYPDTAVVGLSVLAQSYPVDTMIKAGASEVIAKEKAVDELYGAIQRAVTSMHPIYILEDAIECVKARIAHQEKAIRRVREQVPTAKTSSVAQTLKCLERTLMLYKNDLRQFEVGSQLISGHRLRPPLPRPSSTMNC